MTRIRYIIVALLLLTAVPAIASIWVGRTSPTTGLWKQWQTEGEIAIVKGTDGNIRVWREETIDGTIFHVIAEANKAVSGSTIPDMNLRFRGNYQVDVRFEHWDDEPLRPWDDTP